MIFDRTKAPQRAANARVELGGPGSAAARYAAIRSLALRRPRRRHRTPSRHRRRSAGPASRGPVVERRSAAAECSGYHHASGIELDGDCCQPCPRSSVVIGSGSAAVF